MTQETKQKPPFWFWMIAIIGIIWNGLGLNQYLHQVYKTEGLKKMYPDPEVLEAILNTPSWVMAAFATAVLFGLLGCLLLLLRKQWAYPFFVLSLLGAALQSYYTIFMSPAINIYGYGALLMPLTILLLGFIFVIFAKKCVRQSWIN
jgi:lipid-A-disaccharide synthase-like uncharacterized protein